MSATATQSFTSPTPILDRQAPLPKVESQAARAGALLAVSFGLVVCAVLFILWRPAFFRPIARRIDAIMSPMVMGHWSTTTPVLYFFALLAAMFIAVAIHEMAHALAGATVGFRFNSLRVGRLQFDRPFRVSLYRGRGTGAGGWASLFPVKQDRLILRTVVMLLAGPVSNLVSVCLVILSPYSKGMFSALFLTISLFLGLMNLVPFRSRAVISDGGRILMLLRNRARGERWLAIIKLLEELRSGVPHEKLTPVFLAKAVAIEDNSPDTVTAYAFAYIAAFWQHNDDEAARALETCLRHANLAAPSQRQGMMSDAAVFQARRRKRIDLAEQWLGDIPEKGEYPWMRPRGEAAILEAKGDVTGALKKLDEIEKIILAVPNQALRKISLYGLRRWKAELQQQTVAT